MGLTAKDRLTSHNERFKGIRIWLACRGTLAHGGNLADYLICLVCFVLLVFSFGVSAPGRAFEGLSPASGAQYRMGEVTILASRRYAYIDRTGNVVLDLQQYDEVGDFSEGLAPVRLENKRWGFINRTGELRIEPQFERVLGFSEGLAAFEKNGLWGYLDKTGAVVIQPEYAEVHSFSEGIAVVIKEIPKDTVNNNPSQPNEVQTVVRTVLLPVPLEQAALLTKSTLREKETWLIDKTGRPILKRCRADTVHIVSDPGAGFSEGLIVALDDQTKRFGFVDKTCNFVIPPVYEQAARFSEGLARVAIVENGEEKIGFIDRSGKFAIPPKFNSDADFRNSSDFSEGLASLTEGLRPTVTESEKFAYINKRGAIEMLTNFSEAHSFREGLALVRDENTNKWGYIDKSGKMVIPPQFYQAASFSEGLAAVAR